MTPPAAADAVLPGDASPQLVAAGRVGRAHGVHGAMRWHTEADIDWSTGQQVVLRQRDGQQLSGTLLQVRAVCGAHLVHMAQIDSREAAQRCQGATILLDAAQLPACAPGEFYIHELVGLQVCDQHGVHVGHIAQVLNNGGQPLLQIVDPAGDNERLLPAVPACVRRVARAEGTVHVCVPEGLWSA